MVSSDNLNFITDSIGFSTVNNGYGFSKYSFSYYSISELFAPTESLDINDNLLIKFYCLCGDKFLYGQCQYGFSTYVDLSN